MEAALLADYAGDMEVLDPQGVRFRIAALDILAADVPFVQTATRPQNIVSAAVSKGIGFAFRDPLDCLANLDSSEGEKLAIITREIGSTVESAVAREDADGVANGLRRLEQPINAFFDSTMVMAEDKAVREARLSLLHGVNLLLRKAGDFAKIVIVG